LVGSDAEENGRTQVMTGSRGLVTREASGVLGGKRKGRPGPSTWTAAVSPLAGSHGVPGLAAGCAAMPGD